MIPVSSCFHALFFAKLSDFSSIDPACDGMQLSGLISVARSKGILAIKKKVDVKDGQHNHSLPAKVEHRL